MPGFAFVTVLVICGLALYVWIAITNLRTEVQRLRRAIVNLEGGARALRVDAPPTPLPSVARSTDLGEAPPRPAPAPTTPPRVVPQAEPPAAPPTPAWRPAGLSLESFVGGRLMLIAGVVVVLCGVAFFLKFAFDRDWIEPPMRIALGFALGVSALVAGDRLRLHGLRAFGHAIMGGGLGALYLSNYFAAVRYGFFAQPLSFALAAGVTAIGAVLAIKRDAPLLAHLGFFGGFLAPALLSTNVDALESVALWLIVLDLGVLVVLWKRPWRGFDVSALTSSIAYFVHWRMQYLAPAREPMAALVIAALVLAMLSTCLVPPIAARRRVPTTALWTAMFAGLLGFVAAYDVLYPERREWLGVGLVWLAIAYFGAARALAARVPADGAAHDALDLFGLSALAVAVPVVFRGYAIAPAWALAGVATVSLWRSRRMPYFDVGGVVMVLCAIANLVSRHLPSHAEPYVPFVNGAFLSFAISGAALVLCGRILQREPTRTSAGRALIAFGLWFFVPLLASEMSQHFTLDAARYGMRAAEYSIAAAAAILALYAASLAWTVRHLAIARDDASIVLSVPMFGMFVLGLLTATGGHRVPFTPVLNVVFCSALAVVATGFAIRRWLQGAPNKIALYGALLCGLLLIYGELDAYSALGSVAGEAGPDLRFFAQLWISIAWGLYAAALIVVGFRRAAADLRWAGLSVFAITLIKVFVVDMAGLAAAYRIGSFMALGLLLVAASYLYQRSRAPAAPAS